MTHYSDFFHIYVMGSMQVLTSFHFFGRFLKKKANSFYYVFFTMLGIVVIMLVPTNSITFLAYILLLTAGGILICRAGTMFSVLYALITVEIMQFCYGTFNSALCMLYPLVSFRHPVIIFIVSILSDGAALFLSVLCYRTVYKYFLYQEADKNWYTLMILTPTLMIFLIGQYINSTIYGNTITTEGDSIINGVDHCQMFFIQLLGIASLFCILFAHKKMLENFRLNTELSLLEQEEHSLRRYVEEAKERYEKTRSFRHDIKNHITVVKELLQKNRLEQALNYIGNMESMTADLSFPCHTNHPVVDILLANKLGIAKSSGIYVHCSLILPCPCNADDIDLCIILSNALDNAIRACKEIEGNTEKYIYVTGGLQGDFVLVEVENSFHRKGVLRKGTGLTNIKAVAEKYQGVMSVKTRDSVFVLSVLLVIPQQPECISRQSG